MIGPLLRRLAVAAAVPVLLATCAGPGPTSPSAPASPSPAPTATPGPTPLRPSVRWSDCGRGFQCGTVSVPLVRGAAGTSPRINVAVVRLAAADPGRRIGSLVVNPGGPGSPGIEFVRQAARALFSPELRARFDIVGFDPRGVDGSAPIRCRDELDLLVAPDLTPDDAAEREALEMDARRLANGCERRNPGVLAHLSTAAVADDLDAIRRALGDEQLTYVGFSYGTLIGAMYAERHPERVRALVLDGAIDPSLDLATFRGDQARAFERALGRFLDDCAASPSCPFHAGGRTRRAFVDLIARIERRPIESPRSTSGRRVGPGLAWSAILGAMYSRDAWPILARALALADDGDGSLLLVLADPFRGRKDDGTYSNRLDAYTAVTCLDWPAPRDPAAYARLAGELAAVAPNFGALAAWNDLPCAYWPEAAARVPTPITAPGAPPIVVVGTTGDPATPLAWAEALAGQLESGVLVTWEGDGHTAYGGGSSDCVDEAVDTYLLRLEVPTDGLACKD